MGQNKPLAHSNMFCFLNPVWAAEVKDYRHVLYFTYKYAVFKAEET